MPELTAVPDLPAPRSSARAETATVELAAAGERVRALRLLINRSQAQLADAVSVSQAYVSQVESGVRSPTEQFLQEVAGAFDFPRRFLDADPVELPSVTFRFRRRKGTRQTYVRQAEQLLRESYRALWILVRDVSGLTPALPSAPGAAGDPDEIERAAELTREALGLDGDEPVRHLTRAAERAHVLIAPLSLPHAADLEDKPAAVGHDGASCWPAGEVAFAGWFTGGPGDRQRMTLAHELGHLVLHSRGAAHGDIESDAFRFAGALLLPAHRMDDAFTANPTLRSLAQLKARWGVSIQGLIQRARQLGLIDEYRQTSFYKQLSARGWRTVEPVTVHNEEPVLLWKLLQHRFPDSRNPYLAAAEHLGLPPFVLATVIPRPTSGPTGPASSTQRTGSR